MTSDRYARLQLQNESILESHRNRAVELYREDGFEESEHYGPAGTSFCLNQECGPILRQAVRGSRQAAGDLSNRIEDGGQSSQISPILPLMGEGGGNWLWHVYFGEEIDTLQKGGKW